MKACSCPGAIIPEEEPETCLWCWNTRYPRQYKKEDIQLKSLDYCN
jgi:hypothetical protein